MGARDRELEREDVFGEVAFCSRTMRSRAHGEVDAFGCDRSPEGRETCKRLCFQ